MIRVHKRDRAPRILRERGVNQTEENERAYDESPADYRSGAKTFDVKSGIYGAKSVKNALKKDQHSKCAFCEAKVDHVAYGDVEHFRPKKGFDKSIRTTSVDRAIIGSPTRGKISSSPARYATNVIRETCFP